MIKFRTRLILVSAFLLLAACSGKQVPPEKAPEELFQTAENQMERGLWTDALASWEQVRDAFYSPELSMLAELKIAETYYLAERYAEAAIAYEDFLQRYPDDPRTPSLLFRLGQSYYQQILARDRDQASTRHAIRTFQTLVTEYPDSSYVQQAQQYILRCQTRLADHEVYVGRFYFQRGHYQPAIKRLETVLTEFPDYYYRDEAYYFLGRAYLETGQAEQARAVFNLLLEEFPASSFYDDTRKILEKQG